MINGKKIVVVMPAYNAEKTIEKTYADLPKNVVDEVIVVDDCSHDRTVEIAKKMGLKTMVHKKNTGYGGNQKTCYAEALKDGADVVVMLHPDYQYDSTRTLDLIKPILENRYDLMFGSRIRTRTEVLKGGMPLKKYILNRIFCVIENLVLGVNFTEHFSGYRAYASQVLRTLPLKSFSDDFAFDQEFMISAIAAGFRVGEIPVPVRYFSEASSIKWWRGSKFLLQTLLTLGKFVFFKSAGVKFKIFKI
jgi:glycosyltransferase involved in cell wall biosynthesis